MRTFVCSCCRQIRSANPRLKGQQFCGQARCQRERKRRWQRQKLAADSDYQANQRQARQSWRERNPGYWRDYRRRRREKQATISASPVAKMDASTPISPVLSGRYILTPILQSGVKMDALQVEIVLFSTGYSCANKDTIASAAAPD